VLWLKFDSSLRMHSEMFVTGLTRCFTTGASLDQLDGSLP
jgi:hypothetical protein